jgi:alkylated DNA nucleotide flippase Atl1
VSTVVVGKFRPARAVLASVKPEPGAHAPARPRRARAERLARLARLLALAHHIERCIEAGEVASYGDMARRLGITQPRVSQIAALALLPPVVQERVLTGQAGIRIRAAMKAAREAEWPQDSARALRLPG